MASSARIEELRKKFEENPRRYFAPLANEYRKAGDIEQAIAICREYLPQQPGHMSGHIVYGQALYEARQVEEAKTVFETALSLDPENLIALRHLGDIALMVGDSQAARTWYGRVLEADPRNEEIQAQLASIDQAVAAAAPTPATAPSVPTPASATTVEAPAVPPPSKPTPSSAPTVVISAQPRPPAHPTPPAVTAQKPTTEIRVESLSQTPTVEVKLDAVPPPPSPPPVATPPATLPAVEKSPDMTLGLEPTSVTAETQPVPLPTLELDAPVRASAQPIPTGSFSLEGLETTSLAAPPSSAAPPIAPVPVAAAAPPPPPAPPPVSVVLPPAPAAADDLPLLDIGELPSAPAPTAEAAAPPPPTPPTPPAPPPLPEPAVLPPIETPAPIPVLDDWTTAAPEPVAEAEAARDAQESGPFVTETMAELYLHQGHREEALRVYRALLDQRPDDASLMAKVAALTSAPAAPVQDGPTIRDLLNAIALRRPGARPEPPRQNGATPERAPESAVPEPDNVPASTVPEPQRAPASTLQDALGMLLGAVQITPTDESAARALAVAFMDLNGFESGSAGSATISGAPARHASNDLSLESVFKTAEPPTAAKPSSFSFDQFFSQRATAEHSTSSGAPAAASESRDDVAQFTQWLEGLKQR